MFDLFGKVGLDCTALGWMQLSWFGWVRFGLVGLLFLLGVGITLSAFHNMELGGIALC